MNQQDLTNNFVFLLQRLYLFKVKFRILRKPTETALSSALYLQN